MLDTRVAQGQVLAVPRDPGPGSVAKHLGLRFRGALKQPSHRMLLCHTGPGGSGAQWPPEPRWGWEGSRTALGKASARVSSTSPWKGWL